VVVLEEKRPGQLLPADDERSGQESQERAWPNEKIKINIERIPGQIRAVVRTGVG